MRRGRRTSYDDDYIRKNAKTMSAKQMAAHFGVTKSALMSHCHRMQISIAKDTDATTATFSQDIIEKARAMKAQKCSTRDISRATGISESYLKGSIFPNKRRVVVEHLPPVKLTLQERIAAAAGKLRRDIEQAQARAA